MTVADGSVLGVTKIVDNGPDADRWNVVILGDGYQPIEMGRYELDVQNFVQYFRTVAPFNQLWGKINIHRVNVTSTDSFADDPVYCGDGSPASPVTGLTAATYFDSTFCADGIQRSNLHGDEATVLAVSQSRVPHAALTLVIVNSPNVGGGGSRTHPVAFFSTHSTSAEIAIHEIGHSAFNLADEYVGHYLWTLGVSQAPNITTDTNRATTEWRDLILPTTPVPTMRSTDISSPVPIGTVGLFEGAGGHSQGVYRSEYDCIMRNWGSGSPFCKVCQRQIRAVLAPFGGNMSWETSGNSGTNPATEFLGTTDNKPLAIKTNGVERARIAANGNVGIGTNAPRAKLEINNGDLLLKAAANDAGDIIFQDSSGNEKGRIWSEQTVGTGLHFKSGNKIPSAGGKDPDLSINAKGDVGIGTSRPGAKLEINNGDLLLKGTVKSNPGGIVFQGASGIQKGRIWSEPSTGTGLHLSSGDNNPDISINATGNVGIGTNTPGAKLEINNGNVLLKASGNNAGDIIFQSASGLQKGRIWTESNAAGLNLSGGGGNRDVSINAAGNVGIGTAQPSSKLEVRASAAGAAVLTAVNQADGVAVNAICGNPGTRFPAVLAANYGIGAAILGQANQTTNTSFGVLGLIGGGLGPVATTTGGIGVVGSSPAGVGVGGVSNGVTNINHGVEGVANGLGAGVYGHTIWANGIGVAGENSAGGDAGRFFGNVSISGTIFAADKRFRIDHPLAPAEKYLNHSSVESPDRMNVYNGNIKTDKSCEAVVELPDYFEALNRDFRYQLTVIGELAQAAVAREIKGNRFVIRTDRPNVKVSWQVMGIRRDAYAEAHPIIVEEDKADSERGRFLHPEFYAAKSANPDAKRPIGSLSSMFRQEDISAPRRKPKPKTKAKAKAKAKVKAKAKQKPNKRRRK